MEQQIALAAIEAIKNAAQHDKIPTNYINIEIPNIDEWAEGQIIEWFVMMQYQVYDRHRAIDGGGSEKWRNCANTISGICTTASNNLRCMAKCKRYDYFIINDLKRKNKELERVNESLRHKLEIIEQSLSRQ
ncbi:hypothetical protein PV-S19_0377 [Pacmanvirus S19]|nr:hypothetical protein PV-S19_0377 [Pacmanvirus S19]